MIKAILFDLDGVLVEARELHYEAFNKALKKHGYSITRSEHLSTYDGLPTRKKLELLTKRKGLLQTAYDDIWQEKQNQTKRIIKKTFKKDERVRKILADLKKEGYKLAVCSNSIKETAQLMLAKKGLLRYMELLISNQDVRFPKPLIDIRGKPMIQWVVENINVDGKFVFIVRKEHLEKYSLSHLLNLIAPGCEIVVPDKKTEGAAVLVLEAAHLFNDEKPITIVNSDQLLEWNSNEFFYAMAADECDGGIATFPSTHPKWSFVKLGEDGFVVETAEKIPISEYATAGVYYFRRGSDFVRAATQMIKLDIRTRGEFYVCPVYNELLKEKSKVRAFPINKLWGLGTPEDVELFLKEYPHD